MDINATMYLYRVQLRKINYRQVDIEADGPLSSTELQEAATKQGEREFGASDHTEIELVEEIETPPPTIRRIT